MTTGITVGSRAARAQMHIQGLTAEFETEIQRPDSDSQAALNKFYGGMLIYFQDEGVTTPQDLIEIIAELEGRTPEDSEFRRKLRTLVEDLRISGFTVSPTQVRLMV